MDKPLPMTITSSVPHYIRHVVDRLKKEREELVDLSCLLAIMSKNLLVTYYQPILHLDSGTTLGHETLNRPPASPSFLTTECFYEFAGQTRHNLQLERTCRRLSLTGYAQHTAAAGAEDSRLVFVNVNPVMLSHPQYKSGETLALLKELGFRADRVVFELTERQAVKDYSSFERVLSHYREQGFRIAMDDAGTGYNSLKALVHLKPEFIKLDKSLIRGIEHNAEQRMMVQLIRDYAAGSGTAVVAEGIETVEEFRFLRKLRIAYGQGYALGRPELIPVNGTIPASMQENWRDGAGIG